LVPPV